MWKVEWGRYTEVVLLIIYSLGILLRYSDTSEIWIPTSYKLSDNFTTDKASSKSVDVGGSIVKTISLNYLCSGVIFSSSGFMFFSD